MTREQFDARLDSLMNDCDFKGELKEYIARVFTQGAINLEQHEDNFRLPKAMLYCALERLAVQFKPLEWDSELKKEVKNIKIFM
jgi:hypothetical protein